MKAGVVVKVVIISRPKPSESSTNGSAGARRACNSSHLRMNIHEIIDPSFFFGPALHRLVEGRRRFMFQALNLAFFPCLGSFLFPPISISITEPTTHKTFGPKCDGIRLRTIVSEGGGAGRGYLSIRFFVLPFFRWKMFFSLILNISFFGESIFPCL